MSREAYWKKLPPNVGMMLADWFKPLRIMGPGVADPALEDGSLSRRTAGKGRSLSARFDAAMRALAAIYAHRWPLRIGLGIVGFLCGLGLRLAFQSMLGERLAYVTFYPGAEIAALLGGLASGLTAALLSAATVHLWFVPLRDAGDWLGLGTFLVSSAAIAGIAEALHRTWRRLDDSESRRRDADRLLMANQSFQESEERFRAVVSSAMDAIIALDAEQNIILFNRAAEAMFGCRAEQVLGTRIDRFIPERFRAAHPGHVRRFGESGAISRPMGQRGPVQALRADGEEFPIEASLSQFALDGKRVFTVIMRDITERRRAEIALKEADRHKDEFLATLAHELRNPLAPIRNGLHVLRRSGADAPAAKRIQAIMERQADHLVRLVDDLLEISRISRGKIELRRERVDLASVIDDAVEMSRDLVDAGELELRVAKPRSPLPLDADAVRLTQVFANLLNNAAKFTDPGGRVEITAERERDMGVVSVTDTGVGLAKDMLPRVFDLFTQAADGYERGTGGLGIGLALVRNLVELHGGTVEAHSEGKGRGSRFVVRLPLSTETTARASPPEAEERGTKTPCSVLIVDDVPDIAASFALLLGTLEASVRVTHSGVDGVAACADFAPQVVFLDIGMPGMDGYETARRMRALPAGRRAHLVALTGWGGEETRRRAQEAGFDAHFTKPPEFHKIKELLDSIVQTASREEIAD